MTDSAAIAPDTKDWTWVIDQPCPDCGFDAAATPLERLAPLVRESVAAFELALSSPLAATRPRPEVWSDLEYACHVRDVHRTFSYRLRLMLTQDDPHFANWDQDATAVAERYGEQDPAVVAAQLREAAQDVAQTYDAVPGDAWQRRGFRSNGSAFTVASLGRYHLHDVVHHVADLRS